MSAGYSKMKYVDCKTSAVRSLFLTVYSWVILTVVAVLSLPSGPWLIRIRDV